jgi:hypothetical protein
MKFREIIAVYCENYTKYTVWAACRVFLIVHIVSHRYLEIGHGRYKFYPDSS